MSNPFYVSPLGGLDVGGSVSNMANQWKQNELMDMKRTQFEQGQQDREAQVKKQAMLKDLGAKAMGGDLQASQQLWVEAPEYAAQVDKGLGIQNEQQAQQVGGWLEKYLSTPADQRDAFLQSTAKQTPFSIDDDLMAMDPAQRDQYANMLAGRYLNKEQLSMLQGDAGDGSVSQQDFNYYQNLKERDPEAARQFGMSKGYVETGRDAAPTTTQRDWKEYQRLKKEATSEEAKQYGQAAGFVTKEGRELSSGLQKRLSDATDEAVKSSANVIKYNDLASQIDNADLQGGLSGQAGELLKKVTGSQDFRTELRKDYYAIRGSEVVNNLPPGAASDTDIALALAGFPDDSANGQQIASFLRGLAKINEFQKQYNEFKAGYISDNGSERNMLKAWKEQGVEYQTPQRGESDIDPLGLGI